MWQLDRHVALTVAVSFKRADYFSREFSAPIGSLPIGVLEWRCDTSHPQPLFFAEEY
jgi:hypothetical protein